MRPQTDLHPSPVCTGITKSTLFLKTQAEGHQKFLSRKVEFPGPSASRRATLEQQVAVKHRTVQFC